VHRYPEIDQPDSSVPSFHELEQADAMQDGLTQVRLHHKTPAFVQVTVLHFQRAVPVLQSPA
jgi:hypothetical protein